MDINEAKEIITKYVQDGAFVEIQAIGVILLDVLDKLEQLKKWR